MKILHVYKDYAPVLGGIEGSMALLAEGQVRHGVNVTVLVTSESPRTEKEHRHGVEVIRCGRLAKLASTPLSPSFALELRRQRPDITHLHAPYPPGEVVQWLAGRSRATVLTYHSDIVRQRRLGRLYQGLQHRVLASCDRILVTNPPYLETSTMLGRHRERCTVLPLGVDIERFAEPDPELVEGYRRNLGTPLVLFVGRLRYYKGVPHLLDAMEHVPPQLGAHLALVGRGELEAEARRKSSEGGAADRIHWLGDLDDRELAALYHAADLFVLPSIARSEAYGLVLLEAMASKTPVISTELGTGTSWINRHGETGLVIEPANARALAAAIESLLDDPDRLLEMGQNARQRAEELSSERMIERCLAVYREVIG